VTNANTVFSTQLADARIFYTGRGVLTDKQKPGWLARLLDTIWPF
jgi:flagellar L-ring protein precursor FlgH